MTLYIYKNGQQSGPFEENIVLGQLQNGQLSPDDMAIRHGGSEWQTLGTLFPGGTQPRTPAPPVVFPAAAPPPADPPLPAPPVTTAGEPAPLYRKTALQKIFFGLVFLAALTGFVAAAYYFWSLMGSSGDLQNDLRNMSYRVLARDLGIGMLVATFLTLVAFLLTFKRKIIRSNGLRIMVRLLFILIMFIGLAQLAYAGFNYINYRQPISSPRAESNELLRALQEGEAGVGPKGIIALHGPIALGLIFLGLSGVLMTKKGREGTLNDH